MAIPDPILTNEAAQILKVTPSTTRRYADAGLLNATRTPSGVRIFSRSEVEKVAAENRRARRDGLPGR